MKRQRCTTPRTVTIATRMYDESQRVVPALRLAGDWLQQIGFTKGAKVNVAAERGRVVLTVAD